MSWYGFALTHPRSVWACKYDVSNRGYDCEHCEHYHVDCSIGDKIQLALKMGWYNMLPKSLQHKIGDEIMADMQKNVDHLGEIAKDLEKLNYKELLKK